MPVTQEYVSMTKTETILVVLGLDADKKPRAAKFDMADEKPVRKAAAAQGLKIGVPKSDEAMEIATRLVDGKIFASGKGLMPLVNAATYEKLLKLLEIEEPKVETSPAKPRAAPGKPVTISVLVPDPWFNINVGTVVLCRDTSQKDGGWWPAKVSKISDDQKLLTALWLNFGKMPPVVVKRSAVAIMPAKD
jgi:hypothetical protein